MKLLEDSERAIFEAATAATAAASYLKAKAAGEPALTREGDALPDAA